MARTTAEEVPTVENSDDARTAAVSWSSTLPPNFKQMGANGCWSPCHTMNVIKYIIYEVAKTRSYSKRYEQIEKNCKR